MNSRRVFLDCLTNETLRQCNFRRTGQVVDNSCVLREAAVFNQFELDLLGVFGTPINGNTKMTRSELLRRPSERLGSPVCGQPLDYALKRVDVTAESHRPDGWNVCGDEAEEQLVTSMRQCSRSLLLSSN